MNIAARIGVEEGVYAVIGGVAAAGFLYAGAVSTSISWLV